MIKNRLFLITIIILLSHSIVYGNPDTEEQQISYEIDWKKQLLQITITTPISNNTKPLPSTKSSIETDLKQKLPYILLNGIETITIDSRTSGEDFIKMHPDVIAAIFDLSPHLIKVHSIFSNNLKVLNIKYSMDIYPFISKLFIAHTRTSKPSPILDFIPSADFTGIVIYVDKKLPMFGKQNEGSFIPSLFPKIYDKKLNLVMDNLMVSPDSINTSGTVGYQTLSDPLDLPRIGLNPLKVKARGIFGINNTDLLISERDAVKILSRQNNLDLIKQGKILIIYNNID